MEAELKRLEDRNEFLESINKDRIDALAEDKNKAMQRRYGKTNDLAV